MQTENILGKLFLQLTSGTSICLSMLALILTKISYLEKQGTGPTVAKAMETLPQPMRTKRVVDALEARVSSNPDDCATLVTIISMISYIPMC